MTKKFTSSVERPVEPIASVAKTAEALHDVRHQVHLIRDALQSEKRRLGFFLGAGCPLGIYDVDGKASLKHIPDVMGLTSAVRSQLTDEPDFAGWWDKLAKACTTEHCPNPNVEHILTQLRTICALKGAAPVDGMTPADLTTLDAKICVAIAETVGKPLPGHTTAYHRFAAWISQIERVSPIELFTPNYDLLLEEALEHFNVPFFDGFVGAREPFFDVGAMERDAIPSRWTRLWKLHGSINWIRRSDESVFRCYPAEESQQLLIYPSHLKYEQSRRMPYLAMIDRLRAFFRESNPVLIICGYSFVDEHLNEVLLDGLRGNRSSHCFAMLYPRLCDCTTALAHAAKHANLTVLACDGGVVGTRLGSYQPVEPSTITPGGGVEIDSSAGADGGDPIAGLCQLGDFHHFALFLETQFGIDSNGDRNAQSQ